MTDSTLSPGAVTSLLPNEQERKRLRKRRGMKDKLSKYGISSAGFAVIGALTLIFVYLFSEVFPLLKSSTLELEDITYSAPAVSQSAPALHLVLERYEEIGSVYTQQGEAVFFSADTGSIIERVQVQRPAQASIVTSAVSELAKGLVAFGYDNGQVSLIKHEYGLSYPNDQRAITPRIVYPLGEAPIELDSQGTALKALTVQESPQGIVMAAVTVDDRVLLAVFQTQENLFTGEVQVERRAYDLPSLPNGNRIQHILVDRGIQNLIAADDHGYLHYYDIREPGDAVLRGSVPTERGTVTAMTFLVGSVSIITGTDQGAISQWMPVRDAENQYHLRHVRDFDALPGTVTTLAPEYSRKGFLAADQQGHVGVYHATASQTLLIEPLLDSKVNLLAVSPINGRVLLLDAAHNVQVADLWNQHPEISLSSLWQEVWYEGRSGPDYVWQSSSSQDEFEPKMSLVPLTVGTLKAALFAMLFAMPLGIMGAIYSAYFLTPKLRGVVKPTIEIMEALPTVILGFLAGLWLAPFMESNLPAVFSILLGLPLVMLLVAFLWSRLPESVRSAVPEGWEAAILVVPLMLAAWLCVAMSPWVEVTFFGGSMRQWFTDIGITYDQRNAMVVGVAMGFAVIPTIFSIAEDAVFNVPRHLTQGSLALGATRWQTVIGVVIPTASPGIFSAVMMGFGRAVGETMIVLMATGNSPVVNFNIFEGMRTLSANIAVELPETAVGSSHFRVLFLAALVLLALTFVVNTLAEVIRQRLRTRYSNL